MYLGSESDTDRDEDEKARLDDLAMEIVKTKKKDKKIYLEDYKKG